MLSLGSEKKQTLGLPLPNPNLLNGTVTVVDGQELTVEAFLSARTMEHHEIAIRNPGATIGVNLPEGVHFSSESGVFLSQQVFSDDSSHLDPVNSDLNGDGKTDILWRNAKTGDVAAWLMDGEKILSSDFLGTTS